jgi:hypothetical protein
MSKQFQRIMRRSFYIVRLNLIVHLSQIKVEGISRNVIRDSLLVFIEQIIIMHGYWRLLEALNGIHRILEIIAHAQIRITLIEILILRVHLVWDVLRGAEARLGL